MDVLFLSPADWDGVRGRFHHLALRLARSNRVLYIDSLGLRPCKFTGSDVRRMCGRLMKRLSGGGSEPAAGDREAVVRHVSPIVLPFRRRRWIVWLNRALVSGFLRRQMRRYGMRDPVIWLAYPHPDLVAVIGRLSHGPIIYDCVDAWDQFRGLHAGLGESEIALFGRADAVLASAAALAERARRYNPQVFLIPNGVDIDFYRNTLASLERLPAPLETIGRPRIGFIGNIAQWVDIGLVLELARRRPDWNFVLIGPWQCSLPCLHLPNVHWLGAVSYRTVPAYIAGFDVSIIPFAVDGLTGAVDPLKLYESFAVGCAVVATPLPAVSADLAAEVRWARSADEFAAAIEAALREHPSRAEARRQLAAVHSWDRRFAAAAQMLEEHLGLRLGPSPAVAGAAATHEAARWG